MKIIFLILALGATFLWQGLPLLKEKSYKELAVFTFLTVLAFTLALLQVLGVELPNPTKGIEFLVRLVTDARFSFPG